MLDRTLCSEIFVKIWSELESSCACLVRSRIVCFLHRHCYYLLADSGMISIHLHGLIRHRKSRAVGTRNMCLNWAGASCCLLVSCSHQSGKEMWFHRRICSHGHPNHLHNHKLINPPLWAFLCATPKSHTTTPQDPWVELECHVS